MDKRLCLCISSSAFPTGDSQRYSLDVQSQTYDRHKHTNHVSLAGSYRSYLSYTIHKLHVSCNSKDRSVLRSEPQGQTARDGREYACHCIFVGKISRSLFQTWLV